MTASTRARAVAVSPNTICPQQKSAAEDVSPSERRVVAQGEVFKKQVPAGAHTANHESEEKSQRSGHELVVADRPLCMIWMFLRAK